MALRLTTFPQTYVSEMQFAPSDRESAGMAAVGTPRSIRFPASPGASGTRSPEQVASPETPTAAGVPSLARAPPTNALGLRAVRGGEDRAEPQR